MNQAPLPFRHTIIGQFLFFSLILGRFFASFIRCYQLTIGLLLPKVCRFEPSCSSYAIEALTRFGLFKGGILSIKRILRCHPFSPGGYDPIEPKKEGQYHG